MIQQQIYKDTPHHHHPHSKEIYFNLFQFIWTDATDWDKSLQEI